MDEEGYSKSVYPIKQGGQDEAPVPKAQSADLRNAVQGEEPKLGQGREPQADQAQDSQLGQGWEPQASRGEELQVQQPQATQIAQPLKSTSSIEPEKSIGFVHLAMRSLLQLLIFDGVIGLSVAFLMWVLDRVSHVLFSSVGTALTTANAAQVLLSWQGLLLALVTTLIVTGYIAIDIFAHIYFCEGLLTGESGRLPTRAVRSMKQAFKNLPRFFNPSGAAIFIYIVLLSPLAGVGFSIGLTRDLYVPHFIMSVIESTPMYLVAYSLFIVVLIVVGLTNIFSIHGVLLDGLSPWQALRKSRQIVRAHFKDLVKAALKLGLVVGALALFAFVVQYVGNGLLEMIGREFEPGQEGILMYVLMDQDPPAESIAVSAYRSLCFFAGIVALGIVSVGGLLITSCSLMYATHLYHWHAEGQREEPRYPLPPKRVRGWTVVLRIILVLIVVGLVSLVFGVAVEFIMNVDVPVKVVAHRLGGDGAPENSMEGLEFAIGEGCYGAETDIQRTKDGHYVINHDNDFSRLCGNDAKPQDLTLEEVEQLRIRDPLHPDTEADVLTFEELLEAAKGRIKLFVEFKGETADHQMVDDAVRIVREHGAEDDVVFISLKYDCIKYGKETYPEFDYGLLIFAGFGDLNLLECDIVLAEEEMTSDEFIGDAHDADKEVGVWTANTEDDLRKVLHSNADYVITDKVVFARDVQEALDERTDNEFIQDLVWR